MSKTLYLSGPMSGLPQFNFPLFHDVAHALRNDGYIVISPAETDSPEVQAVAEKSPDGAYDADGKVGGETWGDMLARDVKLLADGIDATHTSVATGAQTDIKINIDGVAFLPGWDKSRGARLEAFVMVDSLKDKQFFVVEELLPGGSDQTNKYGLRPVDAAWVQYTLSRKWDDAIKLHTPL